VAGGGVGIGEAVVQQRDTRSGMMDQAQLKTSRLFGSTSL